MNKLSEMLKKRRQELKLSLRSVAEKTGLSHTYIMKLENGYQTRPRLEALAALADALVIPLSEMLEATGMKFNEPDGPAPSGTVAFVRDLKPWPQIMADDNVEARMPIAGLFRELTENPSDFVYFRMPDDSMKPTIQKNDILLMQRCSNPNTRELYAFECCGKVVVRRYYDGIDGAFIMRPDNVDYDAVMGKPCTTVARVSGVLRSYPLGGVSV